MQAYGWASECRARDCARRRLVLILIACLTVELGVIGYCVWRAINHGL